MYKTLFLDIISEENQGPRCSFEVDVQKNVKEAFVMFINLWNTGETSIVTAAQSLRGFQLQVSPALRTLKIIFISGYEIKTQDFLQNKVFVILFVKTKYP